MTRLLDKVEAAIARVEALPADTRRAIFTAFSPERIRAEAARLQARHDSGEDMALFGTLISIKDLFDEAGQVTSAGSRLLADRAAARDDAVAVARLRQAGALMFGRSTMSEFAYSGVGLNPHYGTPSSALVPGVMPGGSTSGGAVAVALGLVDAAIGTDTGGSLRIPAAANGLWGMKPSQGLIDATGVHPLAPTYDTPGPMARDPGLLRAILAIMAAQPLLAEAPRHLRLAVPEGAFTNDLTPEVAALFDAEKTRIEAQGHELVPVDFGWLGARIGLNRIIVAVEAHRIYAGDLDRLAQIGDPRVLARIRFAETLTQAQIDDAYAARAEITRRFDAAMEGFDALLTPTLMMLPPTIAEVEADFDRLNAAMLRNTSLANLADGCALAMPTPGLAPAWSMTMLVGRKGQDAGLLAVAGRICAVF
ncbi:MAG: amidase family protein [Paracoccus sp. (in: a-proteobacteria)]|uniref:amidase n=1 Tax=Paracoccus sp. TaxID=267 RepID=UPI0026DF2C47|nr:amidase family protein [Paracoccus sp. (in: a-proteobacteria)]MDO5622954.1 amidase family protein [Paracoccus sp. (in: a-proteobacteria)]